MDSTILNDVSTAYEFEIRQQEDLRRKSEDNYNYLRGNQWVRYETERAKLEAKGIPVLNLNLILPRIVMILGYNVQNRYDWKAFANGMGTTDFLASLASRLLKHISEESNLKMESAQSVLDCLCANVGGWQVIDWTNENDPLGELLIRRESPFYHLRDSTNECYDINKGEYHIRTKWLSKQTLLEAYPEHKSEIERIVQSKSFSRFTSFFSNMLKKDTTKKLPTAADYFNEKNGLYRVVELWEMNKIQKKALYDLSTDQLIEIPDQMMDRVKSLIAKAENQKYQIINIKTKELRIKTTMANNVVVVNDEPYDVQIGLFPFVPYYAYWIDGQGLANVENLKDYQDEHNKRSSQILHILNSTANSGWWVRRTGEGKASVDMDDLIAGGSKIGYVGTYSGNQPPTKIEPNQIPAGHVYMDERAIRGIDETSGIGPNPMGRQESANESGILFSKRVQQGEIMLTHFFDNVKLSREILGKYLVTAIPKLYKGERIYKIVVDEGNEELLALNTTAINDITKGQFKVVLDDIDRSPSAKMQKFIELSSLIQMMPPQLVDWPTVIRNAPFEDKEKMAIYAERILGMQVQAQQQMQQQKLLPTQEGTQGQMVPQPAENVMKYERQNMPS